MRASATALAAYGKNARRFFVGGNWKANPATTADAHALVATLNGFNLAPTTEVVVAPPSVWLTDVRAKLRKDVAVSAQVRDRRGAGSHSLAGAGARPRPCRRRE